MGDQKLDPDFAIMQEKLEEPSCFGKWEKSTKCGTCWFWPKCKGHKEKPVQRKVVSKPVKPPVKTDKQPKFKDMK